MRRGRDDLDGLRIAAGEDVAPQHRAGQQGLGRLAHGVELGQAEGQLRGQLLGRRLVARRGRSGLGSSRRDFR